MKLLKDSLNEGFLRKNLNLGKEVLIKNWLEKYKIYSYKINSDLTIDVDGGVDLSCYKEEQLPEYIQFGKVTNYFELYRCPNLTSLKGCPKEVGGSFYCYDCSKLESLEGCPEETGIDFSCSGCSKLTSLKGCPKEVGYNFYCYNCGKKFTEDDVKKICDVKRRIITR